MAAWHLILVLRRHLIITAVCAALALGGAFLVDRKPGLYESRTQVFILPPTSATGVNPFQNADANLIMVAGFVARVVGQESSASQTVSDDVTLAGQGLTSGYSVTLPNQGGQWAFYYTEPFLDVQAVGASPQQVQDELAYARAKIDAVLRGRQRDAGVPSSQQIRAQLYPATPVIVYGQGHRSRALSALLVIAIGITIALVSVADERLPRRRRRAQPLEVGRPVLIDQRAAVP